MLHDGPECFEQKLTSKSFQGVEIEMVNKVVSLLELITCTALSFNNICINIAQISHLHNKNEFA